MENPGSITETRNRGTEYGQTSIRETAPTFFTMPTCRILVHYNAVPRPAICHLGPNFHHFPAKLMPHDHILSGRMSGRNFKNVKVRSADSYPLDRDQHITGSLDLWHRPVLEDKFAFTLENGSQHCLTHNIILLVYKTDLLRPIG